MDVGNMMLVCLLGSLPGPPGASVEDAYVQLFPIDKTKCPTIDPIRDISFLLYTSENPLQPDLLILNDDESIKNSHFDFKKPTVLFFHAFFETYTSAAASSIRTAYLQRKDHNIILLDAQRMEAGPWYLAAARNTRVVGEYAATFIDYFVSRGLNLPSLHLIGLSLGAQMAGVCGQNVKSGRIQRITGLDPAGPLFTKWPRNLKLDKGDAEFVDVIHTDAGIFGYPWSIGHADFWPNKGQAPQPGCRIEEVRRRSPDSILEPFFCSHWRSFMFYSESVVTANQFTSTNCKNWNSFLKKDCDANQPTVSMGFNVDHKARGNYYLTTRNMAPFSLQTDPPQTQIEMKEIVTDQPPQKPVEKQPQVVKTEQTYSPQDQSNALPQDEIYDLPQGQSHESSQLQPSQGQTYETQGQLYEQSPHNIFDSQQDLSYELSHAEQPISQDQPHNADQPHSSPHAQSYVPHQDQLYPTPHEQSYAPHQSQSYTQDQSYVSPQHQAQDQSNVSPQHQEQEHSYISLHDSTQDQSHPQDQSYVSPQEKPHALAQDQIYNSPQEQPHGLPQDQSYNSPRDQPHILPQDQSKNSPKDQSHILSQDQSYNSPQDRLHSLTQEQTEIVHQEEFYIAPYDEYSMPQYQENAPHQHQLHLTPQDESYSLPVSQSHNLQQEQLYPPIHEAPQSPPKQKQAEQPPQDSFSSDLQLYQEQKQLNLELHRLPQMAPNNQKVQQNQLRKSYNQLQADIEYNSIRSKMANRPPPQSHHLQLQYFPKKTEKSENQQQTNPTVPLEYQMEQPAGQYLPVQKPDGQTQNKSNNNKNMADSKRRSVTRNKMRSPAQLQFQYYFRH